VSGGQTLKNTVHWEYAKEDENSRIIKVKLVDTNGKNKLLISNVFAALDSLGYGDKNDKLFI
jgi:hypothetical protein